MSEVTRVAISSWQPCADFSAETGGDTAGGASLRNRVDRSTSTVMKIYVHRPTDDTQQGRLGTNIFH